MTDYATTDAPFGLKPWGNVISAHLYAIATAPGAAIYHGDLVEAAGAVLATPIGSLQSIAVEETGAAGSLLGGILALYDEHMDPCLYIASSEAGNGTIAGYALVADSPDQEYIAAEDGDTSSLQAADIGLNIDMVSTASGSTSSGQGAMELDSDTVANTVTLGLKLLGVHPDDTISAAGAAGNHCRFIVKINTAHRGDGIVGV